MKLGKPHRVMTREEYDRYGVESPHIVHWNYDGFGNVAWWPLSSVLPVLEADAESHTNGQSGEK